ncbi:uncharacterized protein LOC128672038 isoform X2 [Plodia interpunctella]|uniref:uncharacterized protein LOC128672038 isoform X2 n=1 Tax=Plodia interpunctella TaxID=58824 RepID=UPI00236837A0|nr:uncharacterized protein LOC128672038 isoform X2 [Plodia interpunctella]
MVSSAGRRSLYRDISGYVNVCAVVCLLLLVGGLSPRSAATPYRSRTMDRQKRSDENSLWGNPCNYTDSDSDSKYTSQNAERVYRQAKFSFEEAAKYKDDFANKLFTVSSFEELSSTMGNNEWLRIMPWYRDEVLPKDKVLDSSVSEEAMSDLMNKIDDVLPSMFKSLKIVLAGLHELTESLRSTDISSDANLSESLNKSVSDVRNVLCYFYDLMKARNLKIYALDDSEIPEITEENQLSVGFLIYRDALNYLEYLTQVFKEMEKNVH